MIEFENLQREINWFPNGEKQGHCSTAFDVVFLKDGLLGGEARVTISWLVYNTGGDGFYTPKGFDVDNVEYEVDIFLLFDENENIVSDLPEGLADEIREEVERMIN